MAPSVGCSSGDARVTGVSRPEERVGTGGFGG